ncbi:MAG: nicotinate-nucleotide adenylyltransferase [Lachnospiraceae bacterium]|nr:nicotinate-nucleotide adenylyltransferase [Lachnospiraceae bacterium]
MKVGIYGGTFDPVHFGHIKLAEKAASQFGLGKVIFVPAGDPYFKSDKRTVSFGAFRAEMIRRAIKDNPRFSLSEIELETPGFSYTSETLCRIKKDNPDYELFFVVGADAFIAIDTWHDPKTIFKEAAVIVAKRDDQIEEDLLNKKIASLREEFGADIRLLSWKGRRVSSSDIRNAATAGEYSFDAPKAVRAFIEKAGLYLPQPSVLQIKYSLKYLLKPLRYKHSLGVAETSEKLAVRHGYQDQKKAYLAGLLHDCGKPFADALSHAAVGAGVARRHFGIDDEEVLSAIRCHTIGREGMSLLDKIVFVADLIEPGRSGFPEIESIRKAAFEDIDRALLMCMESTRNYLKSQGRSIDEESVKVYTYYRNLLSEEKD